MDRITDAWAITDNAFLSKELLFIGAVCIAYFEWEFYIEYKNNELLIKI